MIRVAAHAAGCILAGIGLAALIAWVWLATVDGIELQ